jgi:hypothetical protein
MRRELLPHKPSNPLFKKQVIEFAPLSARVVLAIYHLLELALTLLACRESFLSARAASRIKQDASTSAQDLILRQAGGILKYLNTPVLGPAAMICRLPSPFAWRKLQSRTLTVTPTRIWVPTRTSICKMVPLRLPDFTRSNIMSGNSTPNRLLSHKNMTPTRGVMSAKRKARHPPEFHRRERRNFDPIWRSPGASRWVRTQQRMHFYSCQMR